MRSFNLDDGIRNPELFVRLIQSLLPPGCIEVTRGGEGGVSILRVVALPVSASE
jgi:hypothetical protein